MIILYGDKKMKHCFQKQSILYKGAFMAEFEDAYDLQENVKLVKAWSNHYREIELRGDVWHITKELTLEPKEVKNYIRKRKLCK